MKVGNIQARDYNNKLFGTIVRQYFTRHSSGIRIGYIDDGHRKSNNHLCVRWWNYKKGTWSERLAHPLSRDVDILMPRVGYIVLPTERLAYIDSISIKKNNWSYGYSYHKMKERGLDDYNILSIYGIYKPRVNEKYIGIDRCRYRNGILINNFLYKEDVQ